MNHGEDKMPSFTRILHLCALIAMLVAVPMRLGASLAPDRPLSSFVHQSWQTQQGLPQNSVLSLAQTNDGYLWVGTEEGLAKFDGSHFTTVGTGLQNKTVTALLASRSGELWIGTSGGGLARMSGRTLSAFTTHNGLPSNSILCLFEDAHGTVWAGTDGGGLAYFDREQGLRVLTKSEGLPDNAVYAVAEDTDHSIWIGTRNGLLKLSNRTFSDPVPELAGKQVRAVADDHRGGIWVGTTNAGLYHLRGSQLEHFAKASGLGTDQVESLYVDRAGTLYVGSMDVGVIRFDGKTPAIMGQRDGLLGSEIHALLEDREGDVWIGTAGGGLDSLKQGVFSTITVKDGLPSDTILPILQDHRGNIWIGSDHGLSVREAGRTTTYTKGNGLPDDLVLSIAEDATGNIWAGTRRGLARFADGRWSSFSLQNGLANDFISSLLVDSAGKLWVGTRGGLSRFDGSFVTFTTREGLVNNHVLSLAQDPSGAIWIGTEGGVSRFKDQTFKNYDTRSGLSSDVIRAVYAAPDGSVWFATNGGGLLRLLHGKFTTYRADRGLFDDSLHSILADGKGRLWFTSNRGVFSLEIRQLEEVADGKAANLSPYVYGIADGLKTTEFNGGFQPASCRLNDGRLAFPSTAGVAIIDSISAHNSAPVPTPVVERVLIDQRDYPAGQAFIVPPGRGQIEIQFTAPAFRSPNSIQFSYLLEGFDKDWTPAGSRRAAYYTNIPPGDYKFRVRVDNGDASVESVLPFRLTPHFYQTLAFYALTAVIILTICATIYNWRVNELRGREQKLLACINDKTAALRESERMLRRSRDDLELRVQERTLELVRANQALQTEIFVRRQAEAQMRSAKEEAEAASEALRIILQSVSHELEKPLKEMRAEAENRLDSGLMPAEQEYLRSVAHSASSLSIFVQTLSEAAAQADQNVAAGAQRS